MKRAATVSLFALAFCASSLAAKPAAAPPDASAAFKQLATLAGTWRDSKKPDSPLRIHFYLTAGGTVLAESWEARGKPHSLTLYHPDGKRLIATHYCPQGNQPRLALASAGTRLRFAFLDATDLDPGESHLHDLAFDLTDRQRVGRSEIYRSGNRPSPSELVLIRE
jgi:hypothetical protein